jgi:hypothetical protein
MAARPARGGPWRRVLPVAIAVVVIAGGVVAYLKLHHSGSPTPAASNTLPAAAGSSSARPVTPAAVVKPSSVTVAVLNGTATTGLAHRTAQRLAAAGYREGTVATASDQTHTTTVVAYLAGHRIDAVAVARALKLRLASVQLVDAATKAVACPPPAACTADVVVTVGTDLASQ